MIPPAEGGVCVDDWGNHCDVRVTPKHVLAEHKVGEGRGQTCSSLDCHLGNKVNISIIITIDYHKFHYLVFG